MIDITVDPGAGAAFRQIAEQLRNLIQKGRLEPGSALPSVRKLARQLGTSSLTVHQAYSQLQDQGLVTSSPRKGCRVTPHLGGKAGRNWLGEVSGKGPVSSYESVAETSAVRSMASSVGDPRLFRQDDLIAEIEALRRETPWNFYYADPAGSPELLSQIARILTADGLSTAESDLLVTDGSSRALDLVLSVMAKAGDVVMIQEPGRLYLAELLRLRGLTPSVIRNSESGIDLDHLVHCAKTMGSGLLLVSPDFGHATGLSMPESQRIALVKLAQELGITLIEDGSCRQLRFTQRASPPLSALDPEGCLFIGSFSYTAFPGMRTGFVRAPAGLRRALVSASEATCVSGSRFLQVAIARYLAGGFQAHLASVCKKYQLRKEATMFALRTWTGCSWTNPAGGLSTWVTVSESKSTSDLYRRALEHGIAFAPGRLFLTSGDPDRHLRLSFGRLEPEAVREAVMELGEILAAS